MAEEDRFHEPTSEDQKAGTTALFRPKTHYQRYMEEEHIPIYTGIGIHDVRGLDFGAWDRLGVKGAFVYLDGTEGIKGMHVLEIPGGGFSLPARHLYHEFHYVVEGRGTMESWVGGGRQIVEWGPGSLFYLPPNVYHRLVNATSERVLIIAANNAPPLFNLLRDRRFIFENDYQFHDYYSEDSEFYKFDSEMYTVPSNMRAQMRSNYYPDIVNCAMPLDNQRSPGYRRIQLGWQGFVNEGGIPPFIAQYESGRYSRAHYHASGAVFVCLSGEGYTYNWRRELGMTPWRDGNEEQVRSVSYIPGGLVAAAPGGGSWFHQHFGVSAAPLRTLAFWGGPTAAPDDVGNQETGQNSNAKISEGGCSIGFSWEDPFVRRTYESAIEAIGLRSTMDPDLYETD